MKKITLPISGMTCVNCSNSIEKVTKKLDGMVSADVNFSTGNGVFIFDENRVDIATIKTKIEKLGYKVAKSSEKNDSIEQTTLLVSALIAFAGAMFLHFSHFITVFSHSILTILTVLIATTVQFGPGLRFYTLSYKALSNKTFDMNVLVALGTSAAYFYSLMVVLFPNFFLENLKFLYFDGAAMIIAFILFGRYLEARAKNQATNFMRSLLELVPAKTTIIDKNGQTVEKNRDELEIGDILIVKSGGAIPLDGIVISGDGDVDTSMMSGEALPVYVKAGSLVLGGCILKTGYLQIKATKVFQNSVLAGIIELLNDAQGKKMPIARLADKISSIFVPSVIVISILTFIVWFFIGDTKMAILASISVLIISCPCALGLATPIAIVGGVGKGAKEGIFIKNPLVLEIISKIKFAIFDKTGTLTKGKITVSSSTIKDKKTLSLIASCEAKSEHPLSFAITEYALNNGATLSLDVEKFETKPGLGIVCTSQNNQIAVGAIELMNELKSNISEEILLEYQARLLDGKSTSLASINKVVVGLFSFEDAPKNDARELVSFLKSQNIVPVILTGDKEAPARALANIVGIERVISDVLPHEKYEHIIRFQKQAKVLFVGDGINDSPSLKQADIGIAMNSGADIAKESGDIIIMKSDLLSVKKSIILSQSTMRVIHQNLFWAFIYNLLGIPLAAGVFYSLGFTLTPVYAGIAMSFSSVSVVLNSLRLRFIKLA